MRMVLALPGGPGSPEAAHLWLTPGKRPGKKFPLGKSGQHGTSQESPVISKNCFISNA
jgi:hypothetical protein